MEFEIKLLTLRNGVCPFEHWFAGIRDTPTSTRIRSRLTRIRSGNFGDCKSVDAGVSELRLDFGPGYRIYFGKADQSIVVLIAGGDKSTQQKDIAEAQRLWREYRDVPERFQRNF